jgi:hypothetical protein
MASGQKQVVYNTRERVISPDQNRAQAFADATIAEVMRALLDTQSSTDDLDAGAVATEFASLDSPMVGEIFEGLMVTPQSGATYVFVTAGVAFFVDPDAAADDSNYKFANVAGVSTPGSLVIPANAGGSPRIDVIECSWTSSVLETDSRDIYDPTTDTFSAQSVPKVTGGVVNYRVRSGTIGGGYPAAASGWLILAVVSTPAGSTTVDTCTFWDVRPLINDRVFNPTKMTRAVPKITRQWGKAFFDAVSTTKLSGVFETSLAGRRVGGQIRPGVPLTDATFIDLSAAANQASGQVPTGAQLWFVWFLCPFGLPRWARYTDGPAGRVPRSPRGIPVVSNVAPNKDGTPSAVVALPVSTGLAGSTTSAALACAGATIGAVMTSALFDGIVTTLPNQTPAAQNAGSITSTVATFTLTDNVHYPANASSVLVELRLSDGVASLPAATANDYQPIIETFDPSDATHALTEVQQTSIIIANPTVGAVQPSFCMLARIPLVSAYPTVTPGTHQVKFLYAAMATPSAVTMRVVGWELAG